MLTPCPLDERHGYNLTILLFIEKRKKIKPFSNLTTLSTFKSKKSRIEKVKMSSLMSEQIFFSKPLNNFLHLRQI